MRKLMDIVESINTGIPVIDRITIVDGDMNFERIDEGRIISGRFPDNIRIDQPTHLQGNGQAHAHVYGRKGHELVAVNFDGSSSHGSKGRLHRADADALRGQGFKIRQDRIVEWWVVPGDGPQILLG